MKLVTWNTQWCCGLDGRVDPLRIVQTARELADFDVLCLQEIADGYPGLRGDASADQAAAIAGLLPGFNVVYGPSVEEWDAEGRRSRFGNLVATRLPVRWVRHHALPWPSDPDAESMPRQCMEVTVQDPHLGPVRVMTTHLEFYSARQRAAQAQALRALHAEACGQAEWPPKPPDAPGPTRTKPHTLRAVLCGDFNFGPDAAEYADLTASGPWQWWDSWRLVHGEAPHEPTFEVEDRSVLASAMACDFVFVSHAMKAHVRSIAVDGSTRASDHQPVAVELA